MAHPTPSHTQLRPPTPQTPRVPDEALGERVTLAEEDQERGRAGGGRREEGSGPKTREVDVKTQEQGLGGGRTQEWYLVL